MLDSQVPSNENYTDFKNIKPMEIFNYPNQVSKIIWGINSNNILQISSQVMDFIKEIKIPIQMALYLIDVFSSVREKEIKLFEELYEMISNEFSCIIKPENVKLATLLYHKGFRFEEFKPPMTEEDILNIYSKESPLYYIAWDKVDELKNKFSNLNFDKKIDGKITPFDCAIKYGSELCFNYMKNLGADYTKESSNYAVQGGNNAIFMAMIEDEEPFDKTINTALKYHNSEIVEYLHLHLKQRPNSLAECMYYGNFDFASLILSNGADVNDICVIDERSILILFKYVIILQQSLSFYFNH